MSPRPPKPRTCGCPYWRMAFKPTGYPMDELEKIPFGHDELEALRLCDLLEKTQEEAGTAMGISRGTVQRLVTSARAKVARALVEHCALVFDPGDSKEKTHECLHPCKRRPRNP